MNDQNNNINNPFGGINSNQGQGEINNSVTPPLIPVTSPVPIQSVPPVETTPIQNDISSNTNEQPANNINTLNNSPESTSIEPNQSVPTATNDIPTPPPEINEEEKKRKNKFAKVIVPVLLLVVVVGGVISFSIINKPINIFSTALNKVIEGTNLVYEKDKYFNYELMLNLNSDSEMISQYADYINKVKLSGNIGHDKDDNFITNGKIIHDNNALLDYSILSNKKNNYIKLNNIIDKVFIINNTDELSTDNPALNNNVNLELEDYLSIKDIYLSAIKDSFQFATYKNEFTKLDGKLVKKFILKIDNNFTDRLYAILSTNQEFLDIMVKISNLDVSEVKKQMRDSMKEINERNIELNIFTSLLTTAPKRIEVLSDEISLNIDIDNNKYNYELLSKNVVEYTGSFTDNKTGNGRKITFDLTSSKNPTTLKVNLNLTNVDNIPSLDISNAIKIEELSDEDRQTIMNKLISMSSTEEETVIS